jgi:glycosyltransferase involved in cell wall biosynthesis
MRLHLVGLPWTELTDEFVTCAYTAKIVKAGQMLLDQGHEVFLYSGGRNDAACTEHIELFTTEERLAWFGEHDPNSTWGHVTWDPSSEPWRICNERAQYEILVRAQPHDLLLLTAGTAQEPLSASLPDLLACEPFVGYKGLWSERCAFESHAWRHHVYGLKGIETGRHYDTVIPNFFDPDDFDVDDAGDELLFVGRLIERKGPHVAAEIAKATGRKLLVAGPGARSWGKDWIEGDGIRIEGPVEYLGVLDKTARAEVMARAHALIAPTLYIEPFGGVAVEAMLSGTPVVATDFGAFTETVVEGVSGWRFSTLAEGVTAVDLCADLDAYDIRDYALNRYSLDAVGPLFTHWFENLHTLWSEGWYTLPKEAAR